MDHANMRVAGLRCPTWYIEDRAALKAIRLGQKVLWPRA
jgi:hypothetical protein